MKRRLVLLSISLSIVLTGCTVATGDRSQSASPSSSRMTENVHLVENGKSYEIVTIQEPEGRSNLAVLTRQEIVGAVDNPSDLITSNTWSGIEISQSKLINSWLPKSFNTRKNRENAMVSLAGRTIQKHYSLTELGVKSPDQLLEKFFQKQTQFRNSWWIQEKFPNESLIRDADLIATLKSYGFAVSRTDIVPVLLARPKTGEE